MDFHVKLQGPFWKNIKILRDQNELYLKLREPNLKNRKNSIDPNGISLSMKYINNLKNKKKEMEI